MGAHEPSAAYLTVSVLCTLSCGASGTLLNCGMWSSASLTDAQYPRKLRGNERAGSSSLHCTLSWVGVPVGKPRLLTPGAPGFLLNTVPGQPQACAVMARLAFAVGLFRVAVCTPCLSFLNSCGSAICAYGHRLPNHMFAFSGGNVEH